MNKIVDLFNKVFHRKRGLVIFFLLSFLLWGFLFRGFLFGRLALVNDAVTYYDHIKFYIESLAQGVYPQWDPYWNDGSPNEFFLRRMGSYNPFFLVILILYKIGIPYQSAYLIFLFFYYFLGMVGFYWLCQRIFHNTFISMTAYLLLMFSSLGTMLFASFIIFLFTPIVWFFYFLFSFAERPDRLSYSGSIFCLMLIAITYIPFYFLTFLLLFILVGLFVCPASFIAVGGRSLDFLKKETFFVIIGMVLLFFALIPGAVFMLEARSGEFVLPERHYGIESDNMLAVSQQKIIQGGIIGVDTFYCLFGHWKDFKPGLFYIPILSYVFFLLAGFIKINRRLIWLVLLGSILFLFGLYEATPIYPFLYKHVFFIKYFRNFQFFRWVFLLPLFVLICAEHLNLFLQQFWRPAFEKHKYKMAGVLFLLLMMHPVYVYSHINKNAHKLKKPYAYDVDQTPFRLKRGEWRKTMPDNQDPGVINDGVRFNAKVGHDVYYVSSKYNTMLRNVPYDVFASYRQNKFILYDRVKWITDDQEDMTAIGQVLARNGNLVHVSVPPPLGYFTTDIGTRRGANPHAQVVLESFDDFKIMAFDPNRVELMTDFVVRKFMVYNDNFHPEWQAFINGEKVRIYRSNIAFKGIWLPSGKNKVVFQFGVSPRRYLHFVYIFLYSLCLLYVIMLGVKEYRDLGARI